MSNIHITNHVLTHLKPVKTTLLKFIYIYIMFPVISTEYDCAFLYAQDSGNR